jgi:hypothetical protein
VRKQYKEGIELAKRQRKKKEAAVVVKREGEKRGNYWKQMNMDVIAFLQAGSSKT